MTEIVSWWDEFQKILAQMEPPTSHSSPTLARHKRTKWKCVQTILSKSLLRLKSGTHWNQTLYPQRSSHYGRKHLQRGFILVIGKYSLT